MIKNLSIVIATLLFINSLSAQSDIYWTKTFGAGWDDFGYSVKEIKDGSYLIAGYTCSFIDDSSAHVYLIKTDSSGNSIWTRILGETEWCEQGYSVAETNDRGVIVAGRTWPYNANCSQVYLVKVNRKGNFLWEHTFGGAYDDAGNSVSATEDGGCIIAGWSESFNPSGRRDVYLIKTDRYGDTLWTKTYGGDDFQEGQSVEPTSDGGFIIAGEVKKQEQPGKAMISRVYLLKTDSSGDTAWTKKFRRSTGDYGFSVIETEDGGYVVAGQTIAGPGNSDVYLMKFDSAGTLLWERLYGGQGDDGGHAVAMTADGGFIITGKTKSFGAGSYDIYLVRTDSLGDTLWTRTIGGGGWDEGHSVVVTKDGGYIVAGWTKSFGLGGADIYLIKLDPELGVKEDPAAKSFVSRERLFDNFPNPFFKETIIKCRIEPGKGFGSLKIYNCAGQAVKCFVVRPGADGIWTGRWNGSDDRGRPVPAGVYFYQLETGNSKITKSMIRLSIETTSYHKGGNDD